jgi:predicted transcriptional regulator
MMTLTKPFEALTASDLMSQELVKIPARMTLRSAARMLLQAQVSGAPVIDVSNRCVGVLSSTDYMRWVEKGSPESLAPQRGGFCSEWAVSDLDHVPTDEVCNHMTKDPVMVGPDASIVELARAMLNAHIHRVIVVSDQQYPIGIVSSTDILAAVANREVPM